MIENSAINLFSHPKCINFAMLNLNDFMKKKNPNLISENNEMVKSLMDCGLIKSPVVSTQIRGNFTLAQSKMVTAILVQLQDRIEKNIKARTAAGFSNDLFSMSDVTDGEVTFKIPFSDLGVRADGYDELEKACRDILKLDMTYNEYNEVTGGDDLVMRNIFTEIRIPTSKEDGGTGRRKGYLLVSMSYKSANSAFGMRKGYTEYQLGLISKFKSPRTLRLYTYLSSWRDKGFYVAKYEDLKEYLGTLVYKNDARTEVSLDQYAAWSEFRRAVLMPAYKELKSKADEGVADFYFEFDPIYPGQKKRGNPKEVRFTIIQTNLGREMQTMKQVRKLQALLIEKYHITESEWGLIEPLLSGIEVSALREEMHRIDMMLDKKKPENIHAYASQCLLQWLMKTRPMEFDFDQAVEVREDEAVNIADIVGKEGAEKWNLFGQAVMEVMGQKWHDTFFVCCSPLEVSDTLLHVKTPSQFVIDKWHQDLPQVTERFFEIFGKSVRLKYEY